MDGSNHFNDKSSRQNLREKELLSALEKLKNVVFRDSVPEEYEVEILIQRFEFTYELAWKVLQGRLRESGIVAGTPRDVFRESFKAGWISNADDWFAMLQDRNLTSHVYNEEMARKIVSRIRAKHASTLCTLESLL